MYVCIYKEGHSGDAEGCKHSHKEISSFSYLNKSNHVYSEGRDMRKVVEAHKLEHGINEVSQTEPWLLNTCQYNI